jgi:hypothetical protein
MIIEGIGATEQPLYPALPTVFESYQRMYCFSQGHVRAVVNPVIYTQGIKFNNNCSLVGVEDGSAAQSPSILIVPNPAHAGAAIRMNTAITRGTLSVYNSTGQVVAAEAFSNTMAIPLPGKVSAAGLYFYRILDQGTGKAFSGSFVFE